MRKTNGKETLMAIEYEVRILNVPINKMIDHIEKMGAHRVGSFHQKRFVYDYTPIDKKLQPVGRVQCWNRNDQRKWYVLKTN